MPFRAHDFFLAHQVLDLREEPRVDHGLGKHAFERPAGAERVGDVADAVGAGVAQLLGELQLAVAIERQREDRRQSVAAGFEAAQRLLQRLLEGAADRHRLADRFHLRGESVVGAGELLEGEARNLGDDVVDRRLERRRRRPSRDLVPELVQRVADRELRGDLRDRETGRLRGERRGARHARVHLDHEHAPVLGIDGELDVRSPALDADLAQHGDRGVAHALVFLVGERLGRSHRDRVAGVNAHRIEVLDRADDDAVVLAVPHHLHLVFLPA